MDSTTLLIIIIVLLLLGGGGFYGRGRWYRAECKNGSSARKSDRDVADRCLSADSSSLLVIR